MKFVSTVMTKNDPPLPTNYLVPGMRDKLAIESSTFLSHQIHQIHQIHTQQMPSKVCLHSIKGTTPNVPRITRRNRSHKLHLRRRHPLPNRLLPINLHPQDRRRSPADGLPGGVPPRCAAGARRAEWGEARCGGVQRGGGGCFPGGMRVSF